MTLYQKFKCDHCQIEVIGDINPEADAKWTLVYPPKGWICRRDNRHLCGKCLKLIQKINSEFLKGGKK